jgi:hypothetical protein
MGNQETGGGGSVTWIVDVDRVKKRNGRPDVRSEDKGQDGFLQSGTDEEGAPGEVMTVSVKAPVGRDARQLLDYLQSVGLQMDAFENRVYFNIRIEPNNPDQVRLSWGGNANRRDQPAPLDAGLGAQRLPPPKAL